MGLNVYGEHRKPLPSDLTHLIKPLEELNKFFHHKSVWLHQTFGGDYALRLVHFRNGAPSEWRGCHYLDTSATKWHLVTGMYICCEFNDTTYQHMYILFLQILGMDREHGHVCAFNYHPKTTFRKVKKLIRDALTLVQAN